jgi:hypothetical protein
MTEKYAELDEAIVLKIGVAKARTFHQIASGDLRRMADAIATPDRYGDRPGWRVIDRRLQALRKSGKLSYSRNTGWSAA